MANRSYKRYLDSSEAKLTDMTTRRRADVEWGVPSGSGSASRRDDLDIDNDGDAEPQAETISETEVEDESDQSVADLTPNQDVWPEGVHVSDDEDILHMDMGGFDLPEQAAQDSDDNESIHGEENEDLAQDDFQEGGFDLPEQAAQDSDDNESIHGEENEDLAQAEFQETRHNINLPDGDQPISSEGSDMKKMDSLLAVLCYAVKHHLSGVALQDLITLINLHCPNALPPSKYLFGSAFSDYKGLCQFHFYCDCKEYIGCGDNINYTCEKCRKEFVKEDSMKNGRFFIVLPLTQQLQHLLQFTEVGETILNRDCNRENGDISDITDGMLYKKMKKEGMLGDRENFSLLWNTDGVPVFKSSQSSIWPILTMINELPFKMRKNNILLTALWFGPTKPDMSVFLKPFIEECQQLSTTGFQWMNKQNQITSKAFSLVCTVDSVARPMVQNTMQFNGYDGCMYCKHRGEYHGHAIRYPYTDPPPPKRTDRDFKQTSIRAQESGRVIEGIKGVSMVSMLLYFNMICGFIPDYMHAVCLGTVRRFLNMWLDPANRHQEWFIGRWKQQIDDRLRNVQVTKEISRLPRSLKDIKFWKANEWRTFLYISPVLLSGILPVKYLAHWSMLVCAIFNLNQTKISNRKIMQSEFYLQKFVMFIEPLYGKQEATFNAHLLLHLTDSVRNWGPLWATSAFAFESFNGYMKTLFAGTRYLPQQIFQMLCYIQDLNQNLRFIESHETLMYVAKMMNQNHCVKKARRIGKDVDKLVCLGRGQVLNLTESFKTTIQEFLGEILLVDSVKCFEKFVYNGSLYTSKGYSSKFRRSNSIIIIGNILCDILYLVTFKNCQHNVQCQCQEHIILLVENLTTVRKLAWKQGAELGCSMDFITEVSRGQCMSFRYQEISGKCMQLEMDRTEFVISLPNLIEGD